MNRRQFAVLSALGPLATGTCTSEVSGFREVHRWIFDYEEVLQEGLSFGQQHPGSLYMTLSFRKMLYRDKKTRYNHPYRGLGYVTPDGQIYTFAAPVQQPVVPKHSFEEEVALLREAGESLRQQEAPQLERHRLWGLTRST